ncbi:MAG TPA: acetyltransferase [Candidatus Corynebacterium faecigallinarum]|uniref:Lysine N-acyltransferase MbtK n=2 Tax=Corynebacterium TaxID=1716 RepID=A0A9D1RSQ8_9CORY|nr:acetyltransferase [Candidatus Corynebacterium avicola]HJC84282.1 acetyltransferase [Candidatus Corynebacterium faecigallinarum]
MTHDIQNSDTVDLSVLHRLRTDLPQDVLLPTPPPIPEAYQVREAVGEDQIGLKLRIADPSPESGDVEKITDWMSRPHLVETWEQDWSAEKWAADWRAKLSTTYSLPLIMNYDGEDVGYMEIYRPLRDEIGHVYHSEPHDLGVHVAVGVEELTGRGVFGPLFGDMARSLLDADPECHLVLIEPSASNARVHRVATKCGGIDAGEWQQRADRRVRLFLWTDDTVDPASRLLETPADGDLAEA